MRCTCRLAGNCGKSVIFERFVKKCIMEDKDTIPLFRLGIFPESGHAVTLGDIAVIDDNLDGAEDSHAECIKAVFPTKLLISVSIYCFGGSMAMTLNRKEYVIHANECFFSLPGMIAEDVRQTEDCRVLAIGMTPDLLGRTPSKGVETTRKWLMNRGEPVVVHFSEEV